MDEIQKIVFEIADRCQRRKVPVTDMLAAFVGKVEICHPLSPMDGVTLFVCKKSTQQHAFSRLMAA
jgi:hypothetical protein